MWRGTCDACGDFRALLREAVFRFSHEPSVFLEFFEPFRWTRVPDECESCLLYHSFRDWGAMAKHPRGIVICTRSDARCEQCERFVVDKTRAVLVATAASRSAKKGKIATPIESPRAGKRPVRSGTVIVGGARIVDYQCVPFAFAKFVQGCFVRDELRKEGKDGKIDLDAMNIEELANLRDRAIEKLAEKVAARQAELAAELERLSQFGGKPAKKAQAAPPTARAKKTQRNGEAEQQTKQEAEQVSEAA